jgi:uncharacterized protein (TIGR00290 family)
VAELRENEMDVLLSWSGGKDSSLALREIIGSRRYSVKALLTTVTEEFDRISMHGVRRSLLSAQATSLGLPLEEVWIPKSATNEIYEDRMRTVLTKYKDRGVECVAFGDLFLQDVRSYREEKLAQIGMTGMFPLWGRDTGKLAREFIETGFRAVVCCVDPRKLPGEFCGREYDKAFLKSIPATVDPCGENGEFHTFVYAGPIFSNEIPITKGQVVLRDGFYFADLVPRS